MGLDDKMDNKKDDLGGKAKEGVGKATGDENLERQGKNDQRKSDIKQAGEKAKDAYKKYGPKARELARPPAGRALRRPAPARSGCAAPAGPRPCAPPRGSRRT